MEEIIRHAKEDDIQSLKELWIECFPNDVKYSKFFFERIFKLDFARVVEADGKIASMLHSFPYGFATPEGVLSAKYIYGVGTSSEYRGRGFAGKLLQNEANSCDFIAIIPQSESLFDFYKKYGYTEIFEVSKKVAKPAGGIHLARAREKDIEKLNAMYEKLCDGCIHPIRSHDRWKTIIAEFEFLGGGISLFDGGYCVHYEYNGKTEICELYSEDVPAESLAGAFAKECVITARGEGIKLGAAKIISERAKKVFLKGYGRYLNLMHN